MSTIKERLGYRHEVVDRQLAHAPRDKVASAYDRAQFLAERKKMMQDWADYIDSLSPSPDGALAAQAPTVHVMPSGEVHMPMP